MPRGVRVLRTINKYLQGFCLMIKTRICIVTKQDIDTLIYVFNREVKRALKGNIILNIKISIFVENFESILIYVIYNG